MGSSCLVFQVVYLQASLKYQQKIKCTTSSNQPRPLSVLRGRKENSNDALIKIHSLKMKIHSLLYYFTCYCLIGTQNILIKKASHCFMLCYSLLVNVLRKLCYTNPSARDFPFFLSSYYFIKLKSFSFFYIYRNFKGS